MYLSCPIFVAFVIDLRINRWRKVAGLDQGPGHGGGHENQQQQLPFFKQIMDVLWRIRRKHFCWFCCNGWSQKDRCRSQDVHIENVWQDCKQASGKKIGDESQAVVVGMQELRRIYRSEIITRCTLHFTYRWWLRCTNCAGCIRDASQVVFKMHKLWGMYLRCITRPEWDWEALKVVTSDGGQLTRLWIEIKKT